MSWPPRALLAVLLGLVIIASVLGAFQWVRWRSNKSHSNARPTSAVTSELRSTPPFATKEPERYQATRIITSVEFRDGKPVTTVSSTIIARDGDKRREEYESGSEKALVYLESSEGRFILSPAAKVYAALNAAPPNLEEDGDTSEGPNFSPELLLNATPVLARYENLGSETFAGRPTTKYRITGKDPNSGSVTLIWIDDSLALPVRSETHATVNEQPATVTMELRDLKQSTDAKLFELPKDYLKVDYRRLVPEPGQAGQVPGKEATSSARP